MENKSPQKGKKLGVGRKLSADQEAEMFRLMTTRRPFQLGFKLPYKNAKLYLWTRDMLIQLITQKFGVKLTDGGVVNYLTRWGFPPLNRRKAKEKQCHHTTQAWLEKNLDNLIAHSKAENSQIYWLGDIALIGLHSSEKSRQKRLTVISVISNQGRHRWLTIRGEFNPERQVMLFQSLTGQSRDKVYLIRNTITHFKDGLVIAWLNNNRDKLELLPPLGCSENIDADAVHSFVN